MGLDFRPLATRKKEDDFVCSLLNSEHLYNFACKMLFQMIQKASQLGLTKDHILDIISAQIIKKKDTTALEKPGYQCNTKKQMCEEIVNCKSYPEFYKLNKANNISFMNLMGALYKFQADNLLAERCLDTDSALQNKFMKSVREYFSLPPTMTYSKLKPVIASSEGSWFYLYVLTYMMSEKHNFVHRHLLNEKDYIRQSAFMCPGPKPAKTRKNFKVKKIYTSLTCKRKQLQNLPATNVIRGNTHYKVTKNGIWYNLMKHYKKQMNSGPSGSSIITYQILIDVAKVLQPTLYNKTMLMLCLIADYYYYFHTISEVLQEYTVEADMKPYTLDMNDVAYIQRAIAKAHIKL